MQSKIELGMSSRDHAACVIIGNGIAGMTAAVQARRYEPTLPITIITTQNHPTINTPALKEFFVGTIDKEQLLSFPIGTERDAHIEMIHAEVERIATTDKCLHLSNGGEYGYDSLLIATGSRPSSYRQNIPGHDLDGVMTLHRLHDYLALTRHLQTGSIKQVVVVGSGVHASETVMGLVQRNLTVHWLLRGDLFYSKMLDHRASEMALEYFQQAGVQVWLNTEVVGVVGKIGEVSGVVTTKHSYLPCQLVLFCIGTSPASILADACDVPLKHERGLAVDDQLRTSVSDIYAAGDVAALKSPYSDKHEPRGQWASAVEQGQRAAAAMTGHTEDLQHPLGTFWHSTALGELSLLTVGTPLLIEGAESVVNISSKNYRRVTSVQNKLIGYLSLGHDMVDGLGVKQLIDEGVAASDLETLLLEGTFDPRTYLPKRSIVRVLAGSAPSRLGEASSAGRTSSSLGEKPLPLAVLDTAIRSPLVPHGMVPSLIIHKSWPQIVREVHACIGCNECLFACPALAEPLTIDVLNRETLSGPVSDPVIRFARDCYQCGSCVPPCPVGLHRDAMMLSLKVQLLRSGDEDRYGEGPYGAG